MGYPALAQETLTDHQDAQSKLEQLAGQKGVTPPSSPNAEQQNIGKQLESASGAMFDTTYLQAQISGHQEASTLTRAEINSGRDADVQAYAKDFLPTVLKHLSHAQASANALGIPPKGANTGSGGLVPLEIISAHSTTRYRIAAVRSYLKASLPAEVFDRAGHPRLVLITCGGTFNDSTHEYDHNIVAYAVPS
ncbi:DUF4142 domain-containing protein [Saccharopolyspora shandongensis]|uniref:DUF4142 domain-containing protein n=1 Tax=Saccharopolyspora shandongensis TaxID=418495 RepID=UPI0033C6C04B